MGIIEVLAQALSGKHPIKSTRRKILLGGIEYAVKIAPGRRNSSRIEGTVLLMSLKEMTRENFEAYLASWYRRESRKIFNNSMQYWISALKRMGYDLPQQIDFKIYRMRRAWGRCYYTKGLITFNQYLATAPQESIDCIVLHELCHFLVNSHSAEFYGIMTRVNPSWRRGEMQLKEFAARHRVIK